MLVRALSTAAAAPAAAGAAPATRAVRRANAAGGASAGAFTYRRALVRGLAPNFAEAALRQSGHASSPAIDTALAVRQHGAYVAALRALLPEGVTELPPADGCADSVFIEDAAVVIHGSALLSRPGALSRRGEVVGVGDALPAQLAGAAGVGAAGAPISCVRAPATLDGGDVLYTGREVFVGLSSRTNALGVEAVRHAFPGLRVTGVPLRELAADAAAKTRARLANPAARRLPPHEAAAATLAFSPTPPLHLKSLVTVVGPDTCAVVDSPLGRAVAFFLQDATGVPRAQRAGGGRLSFVMVPERDASAANALFVNGTLLIRSAAEAPHAAAALRHYADAVGVPVVELEASEIAKADGSLTCCSILLH